MRAQRTCVVARHKLYGVWFREKQIRDATKHGQIPHASMKYQAPHAQTSHSLLPYNNHSIHFRAPMSASNERCMSDVEPTFMLNLMISILIIDHIFDTVLQARFSRGKNGLSP
jgi:hypothetical protein